MSIMSEMKQIRKSIGEKEFSKIEKFLRVHPQYLLNDVYYNNQVYRKYENWKKKNNL